MQSRDPGILCDHGIFPEKNRGLGDVILCEQLRNEKAEPDRFLWMVTISLSHDRVH